MRTWNHRTCILMTYTSIHQTSNTPVGALTVPGFTGRCRNQNGLSLGLPWIYSLLSDGVESLGWQFRITSDLALAYTLPLGLQIPCTLGRSWCG